jgi:nucleoside-diphosphate-sugar epimerase
MLHLITGGAGFVGCHLANALVAGGDETVIVDNLSSGRVRNLETALSTGRATFVYGDVAQPVDELEALIAPAVAGRTIDRIWHLASPASPNAYGENPWETLTVNSIGTMGLIDLALRSGARFLYTSTSEIYGDPLVHPQPEHYFGNVDPVGPRACYDEGKRFSEAAVSVAAARRGLDARITRFFNCYGPSMDLQDGRLVPALLEAMGREAKLPIQGTGKQTRSLTYIDDAIELLRLVMERPFDTLQPVNIGNDEERSVEEIARLLAEIAGIAYDPEFVPAREGDPQRRKPDLTLARSLGWAPTTSLHVGLTATYRWFKDARLTYA